MRVECKCGVDDYWVCLVNQDAVMEFTEVDSEGNPEDMYQDYIFDWRPMSYLCKNCNKEYSPKEFEALEREEG